MKLPSTQLLLRGIGVALLLIGLLVSSLVFVTATPGDMNANGVSSNLYVLTRENSKGYNRELERMGGKSLLLASDLADWFDSLWQGRRLAGTLFLLFTGAAGVCFWASSFPPEEQKPVDPADRRDA